MHAEVVHNISETEREVWHFELYTTTMTNLWLDSYSVQSKQPQQRKWRTMLYWWRLDQRYNTLKEPKLPERVINDAKALLKAQIDQLPVTL